MVVARLKPHSAYNKLKPKTQFGGLCVHLWMKWNNHVTPWRIVTREHAARCSDGRQHQSASFNGDEILIKFSLQILSAVFSLKPSIQRRHHKTPKTTNEKMCTQNAIIGSYVHRWQLAADSAHKTIQMPFRPIYLQYSKNENHLIQFSQFLFRVRCHRIAATSRPVCHCRDAVYVFVWLERHVELFGGLLYSLPLDYAPPPPPPLIKRLMKNVRGDGEKDIETTIRRMLDDNVKVSDCISQWCEQERGMKENDGTIFFSSLKWKTVSGWAREARVVQTCRLNGCGSQQPPPLKMSLHIYWVHCPTEEGA